MERDTIRYVLVFFALIMWALSFPAIKFVLEAVDPLTLAAIRFIIPLPLIYSYFRYEQFAGGKRSENSSCNQWNKYGLVAVIRNRLKREGHGSESTREWGNAGLIWAFAIFNVVIPNVFQNYGMQSTPSGVSSIIQGSGPIFTILLASVFLRERLTYFQIFGIIVALVGSILLVSGGELQFDGSVIGKLLILGSALSYAISGVFGKISLKEIGAGELTLKSFLIGGIILTIGALMIESPLDLLKVEGQYWAGILYIAIFPTCLAFIFWFRALKYLPLSKLSISIFIIPLLAVIFSWIFLKESVSYFTVGTGSMVIIGVAVAQLADVNYQKKQRK